MCGTRTSRFAMAQVAAEVRYAMTKGTPATAASSVEVPDFTSATCAARSSVRVSEVTGSPVAASAGAHTLSLSRLSIPPSGWTVTKRIGGLPMLSSIVGPPMTNRATFQNSRTESVMASFSHHSSKIGIR